MTASCRVVDYDWKQYGGWGIRRGRDGSWAYVASSGPVVEVCYTTGGAQKKVLIGAEDPAALVRAVAAARRSEPVRIARWGGRNERPGSGSRRGRGGDLRP